METKINLETSLLSWKLHYEPSNIANVSKLTMNNFLQMFLKLEKESRRSYPSSEFGMAENGTSRDFTSRVVGPRNPKLVRHDHEIDQKGIRHNLSRINPGKLIQIQKKV